MPHHASARAWELQAAAPWFTQGRPLEAELGLHPCHSLLAQAHSFYPREFVRRTRAGFASFQVSYELCLVDGKRLVSVTYEYSDFSLTKSS